MKKLALILASLVLTLSVGCGSQITREDLADKLYVCEKGGFGGDFSISLFADGTVSYYEGMLSSHIGLGTWEFSDGIVTISEKSHNGSARVNRFKAGKDRLEFIEEGSDEFIYVNLSDGTKFKAAENSEGMMFKPVPAPEETN